jgi:hypothetical protein
MRFRLALLALLLPAALDAQAFVRVGAGVTGSSYFLKDFLVEPVNARQSVAPTAQLLVGWRMASDIRIGVEARYAIGTWEVVDREYTDDLGSLKTLNLAAYVDGPISGSLRWEAVAGVLRYQPESEVGPFGSGAPSPWMVGGGASWSRALNSALAVVLSARYDYHGFNTKRLDTEGYASRQSVHRLGLILAVERGF